MNKQIVVNFCIFVAALVLVMLVAFGVQAQQPPVGATARADGGWQVDANTVWYPPQRTAPRAMPTVSVRTISVPNSTPVYAPAPTAPVSSYQTATRTGTVTGGIAGHLDSYRRPQEVVGQQELRVEESRSSVYIDAARQDADLQREANRLQVENQRMALQRERDLNRLALERQEQGRRTVESWSRIIRDSLNDTSRRASQRQRDELRAREQHQDELRDLSREARRWVELQHRSKN